jgi:hypothetical protein
MKFWLISNEANIFLTDADSLVLKQKEKELRIAMASFPSAI